MENNENAPTPEENPEATPPVETPDVQQSAAEDERLKNLKAENARKAEEIRRLREELESRHTEPVKTNDISTWSDAELKIVLADPQYAHLKEKAEAVLDERRFNRFAAKQKELELRERSEEERLTKYPETADPTHPLSVRMNQILKDYHLNNTPAGRLMAAKLAASELSPSKPAADTGRKIDDKRVSDVKGNFTGGNSSKPVNGDKLKEEDLRKLASRGDKNAMRALWEQRGLI